MIQFQSFFELDWCSDDIQWLEAHGEAWRHRGSSLEVIDQGSTAPWRPVVLCRWSLWFLYFLFVALVDCFSRDSFLDLDSLAELPGCSHWLKPTPSACWDNNPCEGLTCGCSLREDKDLVAVYICVSVHLLSTPSLKLSLHLSFAWLFLSVCFLHVKSNKLRTGGMTTWVSGKHELWESFRMTWNICEMLCVKGRRRLYRRDIWNKLKRINNGINILTHGTHDR